MISIAGIIGGINGRFSKIIFLNILQTRDGDGCERSATEVIAAGYRADFERERERGDNLLTNAMTIAAMATSARAKAARLESELTARRSQFWMRLRTRQRAAAPQEFRLAAPSKLEEPIMQLRSIPAAAGCVRTFARFAALVMLVALITIFVG
jgi:hypothetical protein